MAKLLYQGHGSFRLTTNKGEVIYVDPFAGGGYDLPADLILITHGHFDHTKIELCPQKETTMIITHKEALKDGVHQKFDVFGVKIEAVFAGNKNHDPKECVGYLITIDGIKIYASGDTSKTSQMASFAKRKLDYALFCGDGEYNMDIVEASECARLVGARHNILIHTATDGRLYDESKFLAWGAPNKLFIPPGTEINLK